MWLDVFIRGDVVVIEEVFGDFAKCGCGIVASPFAGSWSIVLDEDDKLWVVDGTEAGICGYGGTFSGKGFAVEVGLGGTGFAADEVIFDLRGHGSTVLCSF